jgi:Helix-loop-helix DNA-binding domain
MLGDFFDKVSGPSSFDTAEFFFDKAHPPSGDEQYLFGWGDEPQPTFHGPATSLPQQPMASQSYLGLSHNGHVVMDGLPATSTEVPSGTPTFPRNGHMHQSGHANSASDDPMFPTREVANILMEVNNTSTPGQRSLGSFSAPTPMQSEHRRTSSNPLTRRLPSSHLVPEYYPALNFSQSQARTPMDESEGLASKTKFDIRWGSDGNFLGNGYVAPPEDPSPAEKEKEILRKMECLIAREPSSTNNSGPPSPMDPKKQKIRKASVAAAGSSNHEGTADDHGDSRPGKRRRCSNEDAEEEDGDLPNPKAKKGGRRKNSTSDSSFKRRRSQSGNQKAMRENLTEEQKRSNHIMSEQKRRNLIKQGFDDLCELVPDLKGGGYSKSAVLLQSADWLENLLKGNELLRNILASLEGRG